MNWLVGYTNEPVINAGGLQTGKPVFTPKKDTRFRSRLKMGVTLAHAGLCRPGRAIITSGHASLRWVRT
ncbi:hypothetical protein [Spirosoma oryzae]|uniref:hypothetical protein n=1 Tax=Spirosoma oryzae TaxID=1469603 RepID=UPI0011B26ED9|nr:hypothetical protein [Spirosoma oryzae]